MSKLTVDDKKIEDSYGRLKPNKLLGTKPGVHLINARTRLEIEVLQGDIDAAVRGVSTHCAITRAIQRTVPKAVRVETDVQTIRFSLNNKRYVYLTPRAVQQYVVEFDAGPLNEQGQPDLDPFTFRLWDPQIVPCRKTTATKQQQRDFLAEEIAQTIARDKSAGVSRGAGQALAVESGTGSWGAGVRRIGGQTPPVRSALGRSMSKRTFGARGLQINKKLEDAALKAAQAKSVP